MSQEDKPRLPAELGTVLSDADDCYAKWLDCRDDFFQEEEAGVLIGEMLAEVHAFVSGAVTFGLELTDVQDRMRSRYPEIANEVRFQAAITPTVEPDTTRTAASEVASIKMTAQNKREALEWLVNCDRKYQMPFTDGRLGSFSVFGTRSWTDYAQVVLQSMIADSLLNIEDKLDQLIDQKQREAPSVED